MCPKCDKDIKIGIDRYFFWGNDRPYFNKYLHRDCYIEIVENGGLFNFLMENIEKLQQK